MVRLTRLGGSIYIREGQGNSGGALDLRIVSVREGLRDKVWYCWSAWWLWTRVFPDQGTLHCRCGYQ